LMEEEMKEVSDESSSAKNGSEKVKHTNADCDKLSESFAATAFT